MKAFCSLWLCLCKGDVKVAESVDSPSPKGKEGVQVADGDVEVTRAEGVKQRATTDFVYEDGGSTAWRVASPTGPKGHEARAPSCGDKPARKERDSLLSNDLLRNERTLRALLKKAKLVLSEQSQAFDLERGPAGLIEAGSFHFSGQQDPELARMNADLLETCSAPKPDGRALARVERTLGEVHLWLAARPCPAAATAVLYTVGDGLVHAEHAVRSVGLVRYWQPDHVSVFLALLQLYSGLLIQANRAALQKQQEQSGDGGQQLQQEDGKVLPRDKDGRQLQPAQRSSSGSDVVVMAADQELQQQQRSQPSPLPRPGKPLVPQFSEVSLAYSEQGLGQGLGRGDVLSKQQPAPLTFAVAALLLRPDWLDMLAEALDLLHFSDEYRLAAVRAGREPQESLAKALQLWLFLTQLVKFAAAHADSVQRMDPCLQRLGALLAPPSGTVPRLLELPVAEDTLVAQLHALWLLQVLYDMPDAKVLYSEPLANYYVALHHNAMVQSYEASAADPKSACAELCRIQATLLRSLARHPGATVRAAFARVGTVGWILQEISLEADLLAAAQQEAGGEDRDSSSSSSSTSVTTEGDSDLTVSDNGDGGSEPASRAEVEAAAGERSEIRDGARPQHGPLCPAGAAAAATAAPSPVEARKASKGFSFTYDLNEDVERLIALEDEMGREMELDGFEYDEEGKQLKARSDALQAAAAAAAAAEEAAAAATSGASAAAAPSDPAQTGEQPAMASARDLTSCGSCNSRRSGGVPRLVLGGLRTTSISSMSATAAGQSPAAGVARPPLGRTSHTGNSTVGASSSGRGDDGDFVAGDDGDASSSSDEPRTPSPDAAAAATAAERVAIWSSTLAEAYEAASGGDNSRLPYPPPRSRSRGSGGTHSAGPMPRPSGAALGPAGPSGEQALGLRPKSASAEGSLPGPGDAAAPVRPRELTTGSAVHTGPQGELHLMVQSSGTARAATAGAGSAAAGGSHGRPPLPSKPSLPPLKVGTGLSADAAGTAAAASPSVSARMGPPPPGSTRAMVMLSASNRYNNSTGVAASSPSGATHAAPPPPPPWGSSSASPARDLSRQFHGAGEGSGAAAPQPWVEPAGTGATTASAPGAAGGGGSSASAGAGASPRRPTGPLIPALNLKSLRRRDGGAGGAATDTGRTVPLSSMLRSTNGGSLSNYSGMDSANTLLASAGTAATTTPPSSNAQQRAAAGAGGGGQALPYTLQVGGADGPAGSGGLQCILEAVDSRPPEATYQELACQRLLYQDRATHLLLLKVLLDLLLSPQGVLDPVYVPQYPAHSGVPHAEFILLWHLNAPRNAAVVHDLCRGAQRRAKQVAAAVTARRLASATTATGTAAADAEQQQQQQYTADSAAGGGSAAAHPQPEAAQPQQQQQVAAAAAAAPLGVPPMPVVAAPSRAGAVTRALQLLSRPLFDASRYTNLQFVARGTFGDVYRARMEPPRLQAWPSPKQPADAAAAAAAAGAPAAAAAASTSGSGAAPSQAGPMQVVIKTIQLPGTPHDSCVLADVFGEVSVMERFVGHECICQLLDYGMRDDAYWLVMRRYRCSLAEWRGRQKPLGDLLPAPDTDGGGGGSAPAAAAAAAAACVYLSALAQVVDALRLLASHHVVHFDLKCANVLIEPLPNVRDGELWAPVGGGGGAAAASVAGGAARAAGRVPFRCVLADFGEARAYRCAEEAFTARNRGTEVFKSPEMLLLNAGSGISGINAAAAAGAVAAAAAAAAAAAEQRPCSPLQPHPLSRPVSPSPLTGCRTPGGSRPGTAGSARQRPPLSAAQQHQQQHVLAGAGLASDVWSLGCLAYELLSGTVLFGGDYASVTHRVAFGSGDQLVLTEAERGRLAHLPQLVGLVEGILWRDPSKRPSLEQVRERIEQARASLAAASSAASVVSTP